MIVKDLLLSKPEEIIETVLELYSYDYEDDDEEFLEYKYCTAIENIKSIEPKSNPNILINYAQSSFLI